MKENETLFGSFMFNIATVNSAIFAIVVFTADLSTRNSYTNYSYVNYISKLLFYSDFMYYFTKDKIGSIVMITLVLLTILINVFKGPYRLNLTKLDKDYRTAGKIKEEK